MKVFLTRQYKKSDFLKNAFNLAVGTSIAQIFPILFYPLLGRIYAPAEFGLLATLTSITLILAVLATGKYEKSILIADTKDDAINIIGLVLSISFLFLLISFIILYIFSVHLELLFNEPDLDKWLFICPISAYSIIIFNCYNEWCVRNKYFTYLSWNKIINSSAITLSKVSFGFVNIFRNGLIMGDLIGRVISAIGCAFRALHQDKTAFLQISLNRMQYFGRYYHEFPKIYLPGELLNAISLSLPIFFIGAYFSSIQVGYYAMTMNVLSLPISVISLAIKDVFRQKANEEFVRNGNCFNIYKRLLKILIFLGVLGTALLFFTLPYIFLIVLGKQWRIAGEYSQILLPMIAIEFVGTSLSGILIITKRIKIILYWQIYFILITTLSLLFGCILFREIKTVLLLFSLGRSSAYILEICLSFRSSQRSITNV